MLDYKLIIIKHLNLNLYILFLAFCFARSEVSERFAGITRVCCDSGPAPHITRVAAPAQYDQLRACIQVNKGMLSEILRKKVLVSIG